MRIVRDNVKYPCMGRNFFVNSPLMTSRVRGWGVVGHNIDRRINNTTHLCAQTNALPRSQPPAQLFAVLGTRRLVNPNTCLESAYTRSPPYIQVVDRIKWLTIPTLNRKELEMQESELLWSLSGTHTVLQRKRAKLSILETFSCSA